MFSIHKMEPKKVSFGFNKTVKGSALTSKKTKEENNIEFIKCVEEKKIQLVVEKQEKALLVIPMKENQKTSSALASLKRRRAILLGEEEVTQEIGNVEKINDNLQTNISSKGEDLEKRAARELLEETKKPNSDPTEDTAQLILPITKPDDLPLEGAKEPSLDDYENIPIKEYGLAMLRGMGWVEPPKKTILLDDGPVLRPKGMGLGADKALKPIPLLVQPESGEVLEIKKYAYIRILSGKHKHMYGQIESLDGYAGRVFVKLALGGIRESFNEFLCQPVSRKEYEQYSRCINNSKYEDYKTVKSDLQKKEITSLERTVDVQDKNEKLCNGDQVVKDEHCSNLQNSKVKHKRQRSDSPSSLRHNNHHNSKKNINRSSGSTDSSDSYDRYKKKSTMKHKKAKSKSKHRRKHSPSSIRNENSKRHKKNKKKSHKHKSTS